MARRRVREHKNHIHSFTVYGRVILYASCPSNRTADWLSTGNPLFFAAAASTTIRAAVYTLLCALQIGRAIMLFSNSPNIASDNFHPTNFWTFHLTRNVCVRRTYVKIWNCVSRVDNTKIKRIYKSNGMNSMILEFLICMRLCSELSRGFITHNITHTFW